jgi:TRAP-type mannitol/chloroaromatic compound transport system permease large subunit
MIAFVDLLPVLMFVSLMALIFTGYPIGFILAGIAVVFGGIGMLFGVFTFAEFFIFVPRTWIVAENLQIIAIPLFVFMGVMLERSNIARDLLEALQLILRRVPGGMALSVTLMGVIFAAVTGVVGASVIMLTLIALLAIALFALALALSQWTLERAQWGWWILVGALALAGAMVAGSLAAQRLAGDEMAELKSVVERAVDGA